MNKNGIRKQEADFAILALTKREKFFLISLAIALSDVFKERVPPFL